MTKRYNVGVGDLFETIGLEATNSLLAFMEAQPMFKNVAPLLRAGTLNIRSPLVAQMLPVLVTYGQITAENSDKLLALGQESGPQTDTVTISLPTGHPCQHDVDWLVVQGGTYAAADIVEVAHRADSAMRVGFSAQFIATGNN